VAAVAGSPALVFIGFMGAGKSTAARAAAAALGVEAVDTDDLVQARLGMPIAEFFVQRGEAAFRTEEEDVVSGLLAGPGPPAVVALGGGALGSARVRAALARHTAVLLEVSGATAWERASAEGGRPLAASREGFGALLAERTPAYEELADAILPEGSDVAAALPALAALAAAPAGTRAVWAQSASGGYPVLIGRGLVGSGFWPVAGRRFVISDGIVAGLYGDALEPALGRAAIMPGEQSKTIAHAEIVLTEMVRAGVTRADHVAALGGGVVGDLAGFCAATYQRGIPVVQVPTTLVAQVDSAYGGKTGVDLAEAKNYVGAYHQPAAVLTDPATLGTLPEAERAAGYVEVVKTALIAGGALWERVRSGAAADDAVILGCLRTKLAIVAADERDGGRRQVLNLGHTVGHGIEAATGFARYRHGEAVGLGLLAALRLSGQGGLRAEVAALLQEQGLPTELDPAVDRDAVLAALQRDKKRVGEGPVPFVLVDGPGAVRTGATVPPDDLRAAVAELAP
jgi:shikimate kinase / 3-dehydroquinate synthase